MKIQAILFIAVFQLLAFIATSQSLEDRLSEAVISCETVSTNAQTLILEYDSLESDSLAKVISLWQKECELSEEIERLKILRAIKMRSFNSEDYEDYIKYGLGKFRSRFSEINQLRQKEIYERNRAYYSYVPFNGDLDKYTVSLAMDLIKHQEIGSDEYFMCLFLSKQFDLFYEEIEKVEISTLKSFHFSWRDDLIIYDFVIAGGITNPLGNLKDYFSTSPSFGLGIGFEKDNVRFEFGAVLTFNNSIKQLNFNFDGQNYKTGDLTETRINVVLLRAIELNRKYRAEPLVSMAFNILSTNIDDPYATEDDSGTYGVNTVDIGVGINFLRKMNRKGDVGFHSSIHFSPYNIDYRLKTKIGSLKLENSVFYRF